jgi:hypothetical protein
MPADLLGPDLRVAAAGMPAAAPEHDGVLVLPFDLRPSLPVGTSGGAMSRRQRRPGSLISSGGRVWRRSELIVSLMDAASLCAGITTITPGAGGRRGRAA